MNVDKDFLSGRQTQVRIGNNYSEKYIVCMSIVLNIRKEQLTLNYRESLDGDGGASNSGNG